MTVQFILPEATSFSKERKLHDRLFLVLLYNLLCKTFKDHSSAFAASALSERNPLLQERCFPIASAKVGHFSIPCKTSTKKNCEKISFVPILPLHNIAKSAVKPIFSPLPHPSFFAPKSPFFPLFPVLNPISGDFSRDRPRFLPCEAHFFLVLPRLNPISSDFSRDRSSLFPSHSPFRIARPPFLFRLHLHLRIYSPSAPHSPTLHLLPPLSFSFLPTFPSPSPINARTRAPSRNTRVRVRLHIPTRQEVFVYCLHLFTHLPQSTVHQRVRGEEKREKAFTKHSTTSQSIY